MCCDRGMAHTFSSYIAIGDSFTEGYGDDLPDGTPRGWADLVALGLALASAPATVTYANLAIRGKKLAPIVGEQLDAAITQHPALISMNGGGNDLMRPRVSIKSIADQLEKLEAMFVRGTLTADEFERQKRRLLGP